MSNELTEGCVGAWTPESPQHGMTDIRIYNRALSQSEIEQISQRRGFLPVPKKTWLHKAIAWVRSFYGK